MLISEMGGRIEVRSVLGQGTTFTVVLNRGRRPRPRLIGPADGLVSCHLRHLPNRLAWRRLIPVRPGRAAGRASCVKRPDRVRGRRKSIMRILVADDEKIKRVTLADDLAAQGHEVVTAADGEEAWSNSQPARFDVVVTDLKMPQARRHRTAEADQARPAGRHGSHHDDRLRQHSRGRRGDASWGPSISSPSRSATRTSSRSWPGSSAHAAEAAPTPAQPPLRRRPTSTELIVGRSPAMDRVKRMIEICARTDANVLLCGETGVGKDLIAAAIHRNSHRRGFPYVKVGCTLFPPQLIESELYGHEKGSFTGAEQRRKGRFDLAEGGTLYLDDVDDIPLEQQSKLLRAIEEKVFERVGGTTPIKADVRIIASTKRNLLEKIAEGHVPRGPLLPARRAADRTSRRCASGWRTCRCWPSICLRRIAGDATVPDRAGGHGTAPAARLAGQRPRAGPHPGAGLSGRRRAHHRRVAGSRDGGIAAGRQRSRPRPAGDFQAAMDQTEARAACERPCGPPAATRRPPPPPWA